MKMLAILGRSREPVTYEVRLEVDASMLDEFDDWLLGHVREMLAFPGFQSADVGRASELTDDNRAVRVVAYRVRSRRELDSYLRSHAARMRKEGIRRFGKGFNATRRILPTAEYAAPEGLSVLYDEDRISGGLPICGNCHRPVAGRFCMNCGQEDRTYLLSLRELIAEFFGEMTNFDSRFFRSMRPLLFRPGWLTLEYIRGRRQAYFPPIRMYIIISLLFFFFTALLADEELNRVKVDGPAPVVSDEPASPEDRRRAIRELQQELENADGFERQAFEIALNELRRQERAATGEPATDETPPPEEDAGPEADPAEPPPEEGDDEFDFGFPSFTMEDGKASARGWGSRELNERMARGLEAVQQDPQAFLRTVVDNIPSMMLIFLPLIALVLKLFYAFSRRFYVEHLMFALHFHSAVFLLLLLWMLYAELAAIWKPLEVATQWFAALLWIYIPVYLYKSMRRVYGQGHFMTSIKFFMLTISYIIAASLTSVLLFVAAIYQNA